MGEKQYSIAEAAKKLNLEPHLIHHYEDELALDIPRNERGFRFYGKKEIELLRSIQGLRQKGFALNTIKLVLNDIKRVEQLPPEQLLELRDKLDIAAGINRLDKAFDGGKGELAESKKEEGQLAEEPDEKLEQFKDVLREVVSEVMQKNNQELSTRINYEVSDSVVREMEFMLRRREDKEEEHYRLLDTAISLLRDGERNQEVVVAKEKRKWFRFGS